MQAPQKPMTLTKSQKTRLFIVESMAETFNKRGYSGTSMSDVESVTGLSRGAIYHHFDNKEHIALAAFDYNFEKLCRLVEERMKRSKSFYEKLVVYPEIYHMIASDAIVSGGSPILNTATETDDSHGHLRDRAIKAIKKKEGMIAAIIDMGKRSGEFKKDTDSRQMAVAILSTLEGGLIMSRATNDPVRMKFVIATVRAMVESMVH